MQTTELHVPNRYAIAITSIARVGRKIYLGLTAGARSLAVYDIDQAAITMEPEIFPWVAVCGYCSKCLRARRDSRRQGRRRRLDGHERVLPWRTTNAQRPTADCRSGNLNFDNTVIATPIHEVK